MNSTHRKVGNNGNPLRGSEPRQPLPSMSLQVDFKFFVLVFPLGSLAGVEGDESHGTFTPLGCPRATTAASKTSGWVTNSCSMAKLDAF
jgi:hypothetical protein